MTDIQRMNGTFEPPEQGAHGSILTGTAPVSTMRNYWTEVAAYTKGTRSTVVHTGRLRTLPQRGRKSSWQPPTTRPPMWKIRRIPCSASHGAGYVVKGMKCRSTPSGHLAHPQSRGGTSRSLHSLSVRPARAAATASAAMRNCEPLFERTYGPVKTAALKPSSRAVKKARDARAAVRHPHP